MTVIGDLGTEIEGAPKGLHVAPRTVEDVALVLEEATASGTPVRVWGGGTRQRFGYQPPDGIVLSTRHFAEVEAWEPDDLTMVVGAGARVDEVEEMLAGKGQTAVLPERSGPGSIGGAIATGTSSLRRARLYSLRDRVLEVTLVTGDGRVVRSGGRVVKNVSGFDIHKAAVGAFGSLGVVVSVCFKLWPVPEASATIRLDDPADARLVERPLAVLETPHGTDLFLWGTAPEIEQVAASISGTAQAGLYWPDDPEGSFQWSLRIPPALVADGLSRIGNWRYLALHGVGEIRLGSDNIEGAVDLRIWAEHQGGALVLTDHPDDQPPVDPWGSLPATADLQRKLIHEFDPARIINRNRLPGGM